MFAHTVNAVFYFLDSPFLVEPIKGEGGIIVPPEGYLKAIGGTAGETLALPLKVDDTDAASAAAIGSMTAIPATGGVAILVNATTGATPANDTQADYGKGAVGGGVYSIAIERHAGITAAAATAAANVTRSVTFTSYIQDAAP